MSKSEEARKLQESLLKNSGAIIEKAIRVVGMLGPVQKLAEGQGEKTFAQVLTAWKSDLETLKTKLATVSGITPLKNRLAGDWLEMPKTVPESMKALTEKINASQTKPKLSMRRRF